MSAPYLAQCLCGTIRYEVLAEPLTVYACHCSDCQRRTGSALALSMIVLRDEIRLIQGEPARYCALLPDGRTKNGRICSGCGRRLWGEPQRHPKIAVVQTGTLAQPCGLRPVAHQWTSEAQPWFVFPLGAVKFETQPPDASEMVRLWKATNGSQARGACRDFPVPRCPQSCAVRHQSATSVGGHL